MPAAAEPIARWRPRSSRQARSRNHRMTTRCGARYAGRGVSARDVRARPVEGVRRARVGRRSTRRVSRASLVAGRVRLSAPRGSARAAGAPRAREGFQSVHASVCGERSRGAEGSVGGRRAAAARVGAGRRGRDRSGSRRSADSAMRSATPALLKLLQAPKTRSASALEAVTALGSTGGEGASDALLPTARRSESADPRRRPSIARDARSRRLRVHSLGARCRCRTGRCAPRSRRSSAR